MTIVRTKTPAGDAIVIMPEAEFERLRELAEDAVDAKVLDASLDRLRIGADELLSEADLDALRSAPSPLAFWRSRRGYTLASLAQGSAIPEATIAALEQGDVIAEPRLYERLARILDVEVEDLRPEAA